MFNRKFIKLVEDYREVFGTERGKRVLDDLLKQGHILTSAFDPNPYEMARLEGERNMVLRILALLKESPLKLTQRIDELEKSENLGGDYA